MPNRPLIRHLVITINNEDYVVGSLSIKQYKNEMSYLLHFPEDISAEPLNINLNKKTSPLNHITNHKDKTHIKLLDNTIISEKYEPFLPYNQLIKPLYVESFYTNKNGSYLARKSSKFVSFKEGKKIRIIALNSEINFSVFFALLPSGWQLNEVYISSFDTPQMLFSLDQLCLSALRIENAFVNWDLLVCVSPYLPNGKYEYPNMSLPQRMQNIESPASSINLMLKNIFISKLAQTCHNILLLKNLQKTRINNT